MYGILFVIFLSQRVFDVAFIVVINAVLSFSL